MRRGEGHGGYGGDSLRDPAQDCNLTGLAVLDDKDGGGNPGGFGEQDLSVEIITAILCSVGTGGTTVLLAGVPQEHCPMVW